MEKQERIKNMKKQLVDLQHVSADVQTRIEDIEWMIEFGNDRVVELEDELSDRRKAYDKLKHTRKEIARLTKELINAE